MPLNLVVIDQDGDTGQGLVIDCTKSGSGAYSIPISVEHLQFRSKAKLILAIETAGMFQRLVKHNYWRTAGWILVSMGRVPRRATRRFIRRIPDELKIPVYAFADCNPYGICNIYRTLVDIKRIDDALRSDPFVQHYKKWQDDLLR